MHTQSLLQRERINYQPQLPEALKKLAEATLEPLNNQHSSISPEIASLFPHLTQLSPLLVVKSRKSNSHSPLRIGVVLSGGQAPGGHNVIAGLFDGLKQLHPGSRLYGFYDGPIGILKNKHVEITEAMIKPYRNQGGFDLIGSGRDKIETLEQFQQAEKTVHALKLDGLVVIGGDDSNTNALLLAHYFASKGDPTCVVGVPKTIDGDLKSDDIEVSFGFDTASKTYSDIIGNLMRDAISAKKQYYFVKLMGRSASHLALECALQTHPNLTLISEEILQQKRTLTSLVSEICDLICQRLAKGKEYGIIVIPEGVIEFIPEIKALISELNGLLSKDKPHDAELEKLTGREEKIAYALKLLSPSTSACFQCLPKDIQAQLLLGRDAHGNVQVSKIETERMLIDMVKKELKERSKKGTYQGKFTPQPHFCGYEGRSCLPSNFDSQYCYALGMTAALLLNAKANGFICCIKNLAGPVNQWQAGGIPLAKMMVIEKRHGESKPVIKKALVDMKGAPFQLFNQKRATWATEDDYVTPGPIQFFGPPAITDGITETLRLEAQKK